MEIIYELKPGLKRCEHKMRYTVSLRQPSIDPTFLSSIELTRHCPTTSFRQMRVIGERVLDILSIDTQSTFWEVFDGGFYSG